MIGSVFLPLCALVLVAADVNLDKKVLVLIENIVIRDTHSHFFKALTDRNYELTFKYADDSSLDLKRFGEYNFQHLIIFAPSVREFGGNLNVKALTDFVDSGGNVLVAASHELGEALREFAIECGVQFDEESTRVIDHYNFDITDEGDHTLVISYPENVVNVPVIAGTVKTPLLYRGIGISSDSENPLLVNVMHGSNTSYSYTPEKPVSDYPATIGRNTQLITTLQARNDARVTFVGSIDFFSDALFTSSVSNAVTLKKSEISGNSELSDHLTKWTFKESGVLHIRNVSHHKVGEIFARREYTITDEIVYTIDIETKNANGVWEDFVAHDVQVELVRIDPFIRKKMALKGHGYEVQIKLPDVYGVFKLVVDYHRVGYSHVFSATQISVRPFTHTQYERFILSAFPYYASAISMMAGVFVFSFVYLYLKDGKKAKAE